MERAPSLTTIAGKGAWVIAVSYAMNAAMDAPAPLAEVLALALDRLPDPILLIESTAAAGDVILHGNPAAQSLFRPELDGAPLGAAVRNPLVLEAVDHALETGEDAEAFYDSIGVQPRQWRAMLRPMPPAPDGARRLLLVLRDETDARRTERMRADFMANASHELRTPLASLAGFVETLRTHAREDPEARDRFLGIMAEQAGRMARLIEDLLSLSRIELNEHIAPSGKVDLAQAVQDVLDGLKPIPRDGGAPVAIEVEGRPPPVVGDRDQLVQVIQNLLDNAVKYSPPGGKVRVALSLAGSLEAARAPSRNGAASLPLLDADASSASDRFVVMRVIDQGPGIARQHLPRLSERFYRVEGQSRGGTGLGLAIVKHIVNRHRGGILVESAEGQGTSFSVYLPVSS